MANKKYPHIKDTAFPYLDRVDPYKYENRFDYHRWEADTVLRVCNVPWGSDYSDVVLFRSETDRDNWFENQAGIEQQLFEAYRLDPDGAVRLNIPYDVMQGYNYVTVKLPIATSADEPIDYETPDGLRNYFFFVIDTEAAANSTTKVYLKLDMWTTFIRKTDIKGMMLERGHAPLAASSVDQYLADPVDNSDLLLAPDSTYADPMVATSTKVIPWTEGSQTLWILIATSYDYGQLVNNGQATAAKPSTGPRYSDRSDARWGFQYNVDGYEYGYGGVDYNALTTHIGHAQSQDGNLPNQYQILAINSKYCYGTGSFFAMLRTYYPNVLQTIKALFVVPERFLKMNPTPINLRGYDIYKVQETNSINYPIRLHKEDWAYPTAYASLAKLYTYPYSYLQITDNDGKTTDIRIENMGTDPQLVERVAVTYPYISLQAYMTGTNGNARTTYTWRHLDGSTTSRTAYGAFLVDTLMETKLPTYGLIQSASDDWSMRNWHNQQKARSVAMQDYHKSALVINTSTENARASLDAAQTNANKAAGIAKANANASNSTTRTNAGNDAAMMRANTALSNAATTSNVSEQIATALTQTNYNNEHATTVATQANNMQKATTGITTDSMTALTHVNQATNAINAACGVVGDIMAGNALGAVGGAVSGITGVVSAGFTNDILVAKEQILSTLTQTKNNQEAANTQAINTNQYTWNKDLNLTTTATTVNARTKMTDNSASTHATNANNAATTGDNNAQRNYDLSIETNNRTRDVAVANAEYYQRDASSYPAKLTLEQAQFNIWKDYETHRVDGDITFGNFATDHAGPDAYEYRGIQYRIITQPKAAISQAGDQFLRYGYNLNRYWRLDSIDDLRVMPHYTYWKASDIWARGGTGTTEQALTDIKRILTTGVTVWGDPDDIGRVTIYDN